MHACSACPGADPLAWTGCRSLVSVAPHSAAATGWVWVWCVVGFGTESLALVPAGIMADSGSSFLGHYIIGFLLWLDSIPVFRGSTGYVRDVTKN